MFAIILLAACSNTSKESIVKKLSSELEDMTSYKMEAKMTMHTGKEARTYDVEVLYKKEDNDHFKVTLMNEEEKTGQIILKNNEREYELTHDIKKKKESIIKKLSSELKDKRSYKMEAKMTMHTGKEARTYDVEVLYKKEDNDHFKVTLMNEEEKTGQIILKNNEGVFVLTPDIK